MNATVVYESVYGNTRELAEAIADELGGEAVPVSRAPFSLSGCDLLVVGGPTHIHGLSTTRTRRATVAAAEDEDIHFDPCAAAEPGLRRWLHDLAHCEGQRAATFDTRLDRSPWMTGMASRAIAKRLRRRGCEILDIESFLVQESEGPLEDGELERAREWAAGLAAEDGVGERQESRL